MKILVNNSFGSFRIKKEIREKIWGEKGAHLVDNDEMRVNADLIAMKENGEDIQISWS